MNKSIENHDYFANFKYYSDQTQVLKNYCDKFDEKILNLLARVRILLKKESGKLSRFSLCKASELKISDSIIDAKIKEIREEIRNVREQSQSEIKDVLGS